MQPIYPVCPYCRQRFHARDVGMNRTGRPPAEVEVDPNLQNVPAYASMSNYVRPLRLSRLVQVIERERDNNNC